MNKKLSEEINKDIKRKFPRLSVYSAGIDDIWSMDIIDMTKWKDYNDNYIYALNIIDVFSKFAWSIPLKNKTSLAILEAFENTIKTSHRKPNYIWVDQGKEFYNKDMKKYLQDNKIKIYSTFSEHKASVIERFNRTQKTILYKNFTSNSTYKWVDYLTEIMNTYNNRVHSTIKMKPIDASNKQNERKLWKIYQERASRNDQEIRLFSVGDAVRISNTKGVFQKGYDPNYSLEVFIISKVRPTNPPTYNIEDTLGEEIQGSFYNEELIHTELKGIAIPEQIVKRRKLNGVNQVLVKWQGHSDKFNSWENADNVKL